MTAETELPVEGTPRTPRRAAFRAFGGAWTALVAITSLSVASASAERVKKQKKGKRGSQGPAGPMGPPGAQGNDGLVGPQGERGLAGNISTTQFVNQDTPSVIPTGVGETASSFVQCTNGTVVTGGGFHWFASTESAEKDFVTVVIVSSFADQNGWRVVAKRIASPTEPTESISLSANAVCGG